MLLHKWLLRPLPQCIHRASSARRRQNPAYIVVFSLNYALKWVLFYLLFGAFAVLPPESLALWNRFLVFFLLTACYNYAQGMLKFHLEDWKCFLVELEREEELVHRIRPLLRAGLRVVFALALNISS